MSEKKENMELWNAVCVTDPDVTKEVNVGRKFTAVCAQSQIKVATNLWGPMGDNWAVNSEDFKIIGNYCIYTAYIIYPSGTISIHADIEIIFSSGKRKGMYNDDFTKKVATDALTKGLSKLGFNADIFEGKFDDDKYVAELKAQKKTTTDKERKTKTDPPSKKTEKKEDPPPTQKTGAPKVPERQEIVDKIVAILKNDKFDDKDRVGIKAEIKMAKSNIALEALRAVWQIELNKRLDDFVDDIPGDGELTEEQEKKIDEVAGTLFPKEEQEAKELADRKQLEEPDIY